MKKAFLFLFLCSCLGTIQPSFSASMPASFSSVPHPSGSTLEPAARPKLLKGFKKWLVKRMLKKAARKQQKKNAPGAVLAFLAGLVTLIFGNILTVAISAYTGNGIIILAPIALIITLISGPIALGKANRYPEQYKGKGFAIAGLIMAGATIFTWLLAIAG